jgi:predicted dehydrogenase
VKDLVAQGYVGRVLSCTLTSSTPAGWGEVTDAANSYLADRKNGATVLTIPGGHTLDALCFCLGEFRDVSALVATQRSTIKVVETGESIPKDAPDQVLVAGTLESGAVASVHIQGGMANAPGVRFEIRGTEGALVLTSSGPHLIEMAELRLQGAQGRGETLLTPGHPLQDLPVPASYRWVPSTVPEGPPFNVAQLYALAASDILDGTSRAPDFELALRRHLLLDAVQRASDTGQRQSL